jgi:hypothetical protein
MDNKIKALFEACRHEEWKSNSGLFTKEARRLLALGVDPLSCHGRLPFSLSIEDAPAASPLNFALFQGLGGSEGLSLMVAACRDRMGKEELADAAVCLEAGRLLCLCCGYCPMPSFRRGSNGFALWKAHLRADAAWHAYGALRAFDMASMPLNFDEDVRRRAAAMASACIERIPPGIEEGLRPQGLEREAMGRAYGRWIESSMPLVRGIVAYYHGEQGGGPKALPRGP